MVWNTWIVIGEGFKSDGRQIVKVGVSFSTACRNIDRWIVA